MAIMDLKWVGWIPPVAIPNPDQPTLAIFWHIITSVPKWKVQNHLEFLFKDVFKNYVLNHFLNWKERESCSSADATSVHIDHSILAIATNGLHEYQDRMKNIALCCYTNVKWEIKNLSLITSIAPIFLQFNYFRQNLEQNFTFLLSIF